MSGRNNFLDASAPAFGGDWMCQMPTSLVPEFGEVDERLREATHALAALQCAARAVMVDFEREGDSDVTHEESECHRFALGLDATLELIGRTVENANRCIAGILDSEGGVPLANLRRVPQQERVSELLDAMGDSSVQQGQVIVNAALALLFTKADPMGFVARHYLSPDKPEAWDKPARFREMAARARCPWPCEYAGRDAGDETEAADAATKAATEVGFAERMRRLTEKLNTLGDLVQGDRAEELLLLLERQLFALITNVKEQFAANERPVEVVREEPKVEPTEEPGAAEQAAAAVEVAA